MSLVVIKDCGLLECGIV